MHLFSQLPNITHGHTIQQHQDRPIATLLLDSRQHTAHPDSLFFAIKGKHHDGHQFIQTLYKKGIRQFVVESTNHIDIHQLPEANIIQVDNSTAALQAIAAYHRRQYQLPLLAITGSNGKTMIKEWISQLLALRHHVVKSPKSYNSQVGVPLSVWQIDDTHTYGIFEAGLSQPGEMKHLENVLQPTAGIFTNLGAAHNEGFDSLQQKLEEKALLFRHCQQIYYCLDHTPIHQTLTQHYSQTAQLISWSWHQAEATYQVRQRWLPTQQQTVLTITGPDQKTHTLHLPFGGNASLENAAHCIVPLLHEGFETAQLQPALYRLSALPMRLALKQGIHNCQLIDDSYNNDLAGLKVALEFMAQQTPMDKKTLILSDMLQTGLPPSQLYAQIATLLHDYRISRIIGIGPTIAAHAASLARFELLCYPDTDTLLQEDLTHMFHNELILVKGARNFGLEKITEQLQKRIHSTVLEVDLSAIIHNLNTFRSQVKPTTQLMAVVKALAYGSSSFQIPHLLQHHRVDYLAVAYTDEGIRLRQNGITCPIMVMNPTPDSFDQLLAHQLEPEIYSLPLLQALIDLLHNRQQPIRIHLKLETGMHRLGIAPQEINTLITLLQATPHLHVATIMSHLAASGDPKHDTYTHQQFQQFTHMASQIEQAIGTTTIKHLLNSEGILRFPQYQLDMIRLGIGLYGVGIKTPTQPPLQVANTLKTVISQIKTLPASTTIGYGRNGIAHKNTTIATLAIGYADGFRRTMGNGRGSVWINGHLAPTIGDICMDMCMVDITHLPAKEGDEAIIFGKQHPIDTTAKNMDTIPYEVLTSISERVKRVYYTD